MKEVIILTFDAKVDDLKELAIFYHNQFINVASHNWFNQSTKAVSPIPPGSLISSLTYAESTRLHFYSCIIASTIYAGGFIKIAQPLDSLNDSKEILGAIMFLPPNKRFMPITLKGLYYTGFFKLLYRWKYEGYRRLGLIFEAEVERMEQEAVKQAKEEDSTFPIERAEEALLVVLLAVGESERGKGLARDLIREGEKLYPDQPTILDTADLRTMLVYKRYGFKLIGETKFAEGECDKLGFNLVKGKGNKEEEEESGLSLYAMMKWK